MDVFIGFGYEDKPNCLLENYSIFDWFRHMLMNAKMILDSTSRKSMVEL